MFVKRVFPTANLLFIIFGIINALNTTPSFVIEIQHPQLHSLSSEQNTQSTMTNDNSDYCSRQNHDSDEERVWLFLYTI